MKELELKLKEVTAELAAEREKVLLRIILTILYGYQFMKGTRGCFCTHIDGFMQVAKLTVENNKKDYRMSHLVRSLKETDLKLEQLTAK